MQRLAFASIFIFAACLDKTDAPKGEVDESEPPSDPTSAQNSGPKADDPRNLVAYSLESAHPYSNNLNKTYTLDLASVVPSCATRVKVHFTMLRTEAGYDFLRVRNGAGQTVNTYDGNRDDTWSSWVDLSAAKTMSVRLTTDYSVVRDGFTIDQLEWEGAVACLPQVEILCSADSIDLRRPAAACGCPETPHCTPFSTVKVSHTIGGGFTGQVTGKKTEGLTLSTTVYTPSTSETVTPVGSIDPDALRDFLEFVESNGVLYGTGRADIANWTECLSITTDQETVSYCAQAGDHAQNVEDAIARFEALAACGGTDGATCSSGYTCNAGECEEQGCVCPAVYMPVCGVNGTTYSNGCAAACANADVAHNGECGIAGDQCGTIRGLGCQDGFKCRYGASQFEAPFPDAGGACVAQNYCDAAPDCNGLPHIAVPGSWECAQNTCNWRVGPAPFTVFPNWKFETAHPYANNVAQWKELYLPAGTTKMRLITAGVFDLETNYDFLEVWSWVNNAWVRTKRYTGQVGPSVNDEFEGRYFYLKFVSDSSIVREGFNVLAEYR